jgi:hypothetical protein
LNDGCQQNGQISCAIGQVELRKLQRIVIKFQIIVLYSVVPDKSSYKNYFTAPK